MITNDNTIKFKKKQQETYQKRIDSLLDTLPDYCAGFELFLQQRNVIKTRMEYLQDIYTFFRFLQTRNPLIKEISTDVSLSILESLNGFDFDDYSAWLTNYSYDGDTVYHNSNATKKRKYASIRSLFHYLYVRDMINCNPSEKAIIPKVRQKKRENIRILEDNECELFLNCIEDEYGKAQNKYVESLRKEKTSDKIKMKPSLILRDKAIVYLFLGTGLRVSELCAIDCANINWKLGYINVIRKEDLDDMNTSDQVYLSDEVKTVLLSYLNEARDNIGADSDNYDALFLSSKHCRMTPRAIELMIKNYADKALGSEHGITPHKLRATFGTRYYKMTGGDISATSTAMNHSGIEVTAKYYVQEDKKAKQRVRDMKI